MIFEKEKHPRQCPRPMRRSLVIEYALQKLSQDPRRWTVDVGFGVSLDPVVSGDHVFNTIGRAYKRNVTSVVEAIVSV